MLLSELLSADRVCLALGSRTKDEMLRELVALATRGTRPGVAEAVLASVRERERVLSTGIGDGVAIPHGRTPALDTLLMAAGTVAEPMDFDALDGARVEFFFLLIGPDASGADHVRALSRMARLLRRDEVRAGLRAARSGEDFIGVLRDAEAS